MINNEDHLFRKIKAERQALAILRILANPVAGGQSNDSILGAYLEHCGMYSTPEEIALSSACWSGWGF